MATSEADKVITYQNPAGDTTVRICRDCDDRMRRKGIWPHDHRGVELCNVLMGRTVGTCTVCRRGEWRCNAY
jgi:hypothetical protein